MMRVVFLYFRKHFQKQKDDSNFHLNNYLLHDYLNPTILSLTVSSHFICIHYAGSLQYTLFTFKPFKVKGINQKNGTKEKNTNIFHAQVFFCT